MTYAIKPYPAVNETSVASYGGVFDGDELRQIHVYGQHALDVATVDGGLPSGIRKSRVGWIEQTADTDWVYERLSDAVKQANMQYFQFDLICFAEPLQYTVYTENGHYDWHMDKGPDVPGPRKLSLTIQLSSHDTYEGGDLEFQLGSNTEKAPRAYGEMIFFPSWIIHRVTPVTRGVRRSLVAWVHGPQFR